MEDLTEALFNFYSSPKDIPSMDLDYQEIPHNAVTFMQDAAKIQFLSGNEYLYPSPDLYNAAFRLKPDYIQDELYEAMLMEVYNAKLDRLNT